MGNLGDGAAVLHVGGIAASTENTSHLDVFIGVGGRNQGTSGIIDQSCDFNRNSL